MSADKERLNKMVRMLVDTVLLDDCEKIRRKEAASPSSSPYARDAIKKLLRLSDALREVTMSAAELNGAVLQARDSMGKLKQALEHLNSMQSNGDAIDVRVHGQLEDSWICTECGGTGYDTDSPGLQTVCTACNGEGRQRVERT